ncbi:MAG TPA: hypothetical protein O0X73_04915, partial [Methanocorpusculum sp.]|nr:hypothetical protein [Methanocorpusculum sp.]
MSWNDERVQQFLFVLENSYNPEQDQESIVNRYHAFMEDPNSLACCLSILGSETVGEACIWSILRFLKRFPHKGKYFALLGQYSGINMCDRICALFERAYAEFLKDRSELSKFKSEVLGECIVCVCSGRERRQNDVVGMYANCILELIEHDDPGIVVLGLELGRQLVERWEKETICECEPLLRIFLADVLLGKAERYIVQDEWTDVYCSLFETWHSVAHRFVDLYVNCNEMKIMKFANAVLGLMVMPLPARVAQLVMCAAKFISKCFDAVDCEGKEDLLERLKQLFTPDRLIGICEASMTQIPVVGMPFCRDLLSLFLRILFKVFGLMISENNFDLFFQFAAVILELT